jgi:PAS domain S-box-containing protein
MGPFLEILNHLGLFAAVGVIAGFVDFGFKREPFRRLVAGLVFACGAVIGMLNPVVIAPGLIFDARSVLISLAGLYFGPAAGLIAAVPAALLRWSQGGVGAAMGISVIAASCLLGCAAYLRRGDTRREAPLLKLWLFGVAVHAAMLALTFILPADRALTTLRFIGLPVIILYPLATLAIGQIINHSILQRRTMADLATSERRLRAISDNLPNGMIYQATIHADGRREFTYVGEGVRRMYGADPAAVLADPSLIYDRIHPDDIARLTEEEDAANRELATFKSEARVVEPSGAVRWSSFVSTPRRLADGSTVWDGMEFVITDRKAYEERLAQALEDKETLLRELYHRTKNTLQVVRSLLLLQAADHPDNEAVQRLVRSSEERIQAIALVHQMLYRGQDLSNVAMAEYVRELASLLVDAYADTGYRVALDLDVADLKMELDVAIPLGLIINELVTNSLKYAFPGGRPGTIGIRFAALEAGRFELSYRDDGVGLPPGFDAERQATLGTKLILNIGGDQLGGTVEFSPPPGFACSIAFPPPRSARSAGAETGPAGPA